MLATIIKRYGVGAVALFALLLFGIPYSASAQADKGGDGQKVFEQNCAKCHGSDGSADSAIGKAVGAKDLRAAEVQKMTDAQIATQIAQGKGNMPPFEGTLNKAQIDALIPYVRQFSKKQGSKKSS